jgi:hypothetical protein
MSWGDGSADSSAKALPEMVLPMSHQLGLRNAGRDEVQADNRLLIPQISSVNPSVLRLRLRPKPRTASRPLGSLAAIEPGLNLSRIDREIPRDLLGG